MPVASGATSAVPSSASNELPLIVPAPAPASTDTVDSPASSSRTPTPTPTLEIHFGDNADILPRLPDESFDLIYIDPPFNTGKTQQRRRTKTVRDPIAGDRTGFGGNRYRTIDLGATSFPDAFDNFMDFIEPRLREAHRLLAPDGSFFLHIDCRESHYCKVLLDRIFGRAAFMNEIIWAYDYGARAKRRWPAKHDSIFWYAKNPRRYTYRYDDIDRIPYLAPGLVGPEKAARGKTPTDVWWQTIVSPNGKEKTGYATQKPLAILERIVKVHSNPGDRVLDFFAGSGTTGEAAVRNGREAVLIDANPEAIAVMQARLGFARPRVFGVDQADEMDETGKTVGKDEIDEADMTGAADSVDAMVETGAVAGAGGRQ